MHPGLVTAERRVRHRGPARTDAQERGPGAARGLRIMPIPANHHLGARPVVRQEQDQGVLHRPHRAHLPQHPPDLTIHPIHHGRVDRKFVGLKPLLCRGQLPPGNRPVHLIAPEPGQGLGKRIRGLQPALHGREKASAHPDPAHPLPALPPQEVPPPEVAPLVAGNILGRGLDGKVRGGEGQVLEEGLPGVPLRVLPQAANRVARDRGRGVIPAPLGNRRKRPVILGMKPGSEVAVVVVQAVRALKPILQRPAVDVPLARVIRVVAQGAQEVGQQPRPPGPGPQRPAGNPRHRVAADRLGVVAGEQRSP